MKTQKYKVEIEMTDDDDISIDAIHACLVENFGDKRRISVQKLLQSDDERVYNLTTMM